MSVSVIDLALMGVSGGDEVGCCGIIWDQVIEGGWFYCPYCGEGVPVE